LGDAGTGLIEECDAIFGDFCGEKFPSWARFKIRVSVKLNFQLSIQARSALRIVNRNILIFLQRQRIFIPPPNALPCPT
jgi:hypothetical protein